MKTCFYHIFARHLLDTFESQIPNKHLNYLVLNLISSFCRILYVQQYNYYVLTHITHLNLSLPEQGAA